MTNQPKEGPKPGIRSTEFWGKSLLQLVLILNAIFGLGIELSAEASLQIAAGLEAVYALARGIAKKAAATSSTLATGDTNVTNELERKPIHIVSVNDPSKD